MSVTVEVFIKFKGSEKQLLEILADDFLILVNKKKYWFLNYIEIGLSARRYSPDSFTGREFRPYNFVLSGTTYSGSPSMDTARDAHTIIMDTLAQMLAVRLKTRTMSYCGNDGGLRRYRYVRPTTKNSSTVLLDEKTRKPPKGFYQ
jgi:hypothetical protein